MRHGRALMLVVCLALVGMFGSCRDFDPGPPLRVEVPEESIALQSTTGNDTLCCCRVVGQAINLSSVPVNTTLKFEAYRADQEEPFGVAVDFMANLKPNEDRAISASGLLVECSTIDRVELVDVDLRAVVFP